MFHVHSLTGLISENRKPKICNDCVQQFVLEGEKYLKHTYAISEISDVTGNEKNTLWHNSQL